MFFVPGRRGRLGHLHSWHVMLRLLFFDEAFIGPPAQLRTLFTLDDLRSRLEVVFALTGDSLDEALSRHGELEPMHRLRNDALFALSAPERGGRRHLCGQPTQLPARRKATQGSSST